MTTLHDVATFGKMAFELDDEFDAWCRLVDAATAVDTPEAWRQADELYARYQANAALARERRKAELLVPQIKAALARPLVDLAGQHLVAEFFTAAHTAVCVECEAALEPHELDYIDAEYPICLRCQVRSY